MGQTFKAGFYTAITTVFIGLAACGGGGGDTPTEVENDPATDPAASDPIIEAGCVESISPGYSGSLDPSANGGEADADGAGNGVGVGDGSGSVGAGGSLGRFRNVKISMLRLVGADQKTVTGKSDDRGLATLKVCYLGSPYKISISGLNDATTKSDYFDEAVENYVEFRPDETFSVIVESMSRGFVGITPFTEAASRINENGVQASLSPLTKSTSTKTITEQVSNANNVVATILADQLPGNFRAQSNNGRFDITGLPVPLDDLNIGRQDSIPDNNRGRYSAANAGFSLQSKEFLAGEPRPAIVSAQQFADDMSDGRLDLINLQGCSIATPPAGSSAQRTCDGSNGELIAYTADSLWRSKSIATGAITTQTGVSALRNLEAELADYSTDVQKVIQVDPCPDGNPPCGDSFITRTDLAQAVKLNTRGQLSIERRAGTNFDVNAAGTNIGFVRDEATYRVNERAGVPGFIDVRVGTGGQVVALHNDRRTVTYLPPLEPYQVTGNESSVADAKARLRASMDNLGDRQIAIDQPIVSISIPPSSRITAAGSDATIFSLVLGDGRLANVSAREAISIVKLQWPIVALAYDKFIPPGQVPAYGPVASLGSYPFAGPRRQFFLTRQGKVRVIIEGNSNSPGVELNIPGRVVQIAAESRANVYARTSEGRVFWINADQAGQPLHAIVPVAVGKAACWIARREAVICENGTVLRWPENLRSIEFRSPGESADEPASITYVPESIGVPSEVPLGAKPIWRLNSVDEFYLAGESAGAFKSEGIRYLPVNGEPFDPDEIATGVRSLGRSKCVFERSNGPDVANYLYGWQIRRALKSALGGLASTAARVPSNGRRLLNSPSGVPPLSPLLRAEAVVSASTSSSLPLGNPGESIDDPNCRQPENEAARVQFPGDLNRVADIAAMIAQGFAAPRFELRSAINLIDAQQRTTERSDLPAFAVQGVLGERGSEFFLDFDTAVVANRRRQIETPLLVWDDNKKYGLDRTLRQWVYDYRQPINGQRDDLDVYDDIGEAACSTGDERCLFISLVPRAYFNNPQQFRMCFDLSFNTPLPAATRAFRPVCTVHDFAGELAGAVMQHKWFYPPREPKAPGNELDFGFLLTIPD